MKLHILGFIKVLTQIQLGLFSSQPVWQQLRPEPKTQLCGRDLISSWLPELGRPDVVLVVAGRQTTCGS